MTLTHDRHRDQFQRPELSAASACCGVNTWTWIPFVTRTTRVHTQQASRWPGSALEAITTYVPTGYIPGKLPSYRPRMSQIRFEMQRRPTRETYYTLSNRYGRVRRGSNPQYYNYPTFERGLAHTRQHPTRQSRSPLPMEVCRLDQHRVIP